MANPRKISTRLFPLEADFGVVKANQTDDPKERFNTYYSVSLSRSSSTSQSKTNTKTKKKWGFFGPAVEKQTKKEISLSTYRTLQARGVGISMSTAPFILPSGYYVHDQESCSDGKKKPEHHTRLSNICAEGGCGEIAEAIDMSLIALVRQEADFHQLTAVSKDRSKVYLYDIFPSHGIWIDYTGKTSMQDDFAIRSSSVRDDGKASGILICTSSHISSIAGFPHDKKCYLAIADLDPAHGVGDYTCDIVVGEIKGSHFVNKRYLRSFPNQFTGADAKPAQLFAGENGILFAYQPTPFATTWHRIIAWDLKAVPRPQMLDTNLKMDGSDKYKIAECPCPPLFNITSSADGRYLTGLEQQTGSESNVFHCYELCPDTASLKHHKIVLSERVTDCVVGHDGQVYAATSTSELHQFNFGNDSQVKQLGHIQDLCQQAVPEEVLGERRARVSIRR